MTATETQIRDRNEVYLAGNWRAPRAVRPPVAVSNSADGTPLAEVVQAGPDDVDVAVAAARAVGPRIAATTPQWRADQLTAIADALEDRADECAETMALEVGTALRVSRAIQLGLPVQVLRAYAEAVEQIAWQDRIGHSLVLRHPVGVVGAITPWNYPLHQAAAKLGAAIAAGCPLVLKPSNVAPLSAFLLAEAVDSTELPPGAFSLIPGAGVEVGEAIARHPGIGVVSFTGSTSAGARVAALAAPNIVKVALELGGKSASIVLPGADLAKAVKVSTRNAFLNSGQTCSAWTRLIVPRAALADVADLVSAELDALRVGHPLAPDTRLGPLASQEQQDSVQRYLDHGRATGLSALTSGAGHPTEGYFVEPTAFIDVPATSRLATEEIFGPVLVVIGYDDVEQAISIANDSEYGLSGAVWGADDDQALAVARRMQTGQVDVNGAGFNAAAPFGGFRKSGIGRELGRFGIEEFLEVSSIQLPA